MTPQEKPQRVETNPVVVLGGRSFVAAYLLRRLAEHQRRVSVVSRQPLTLPPSLTTYCSPVLADISKGQWKPELDSTVISLLPLWILANHLDLLKEANAIIAVGSTSVFSRAASDDPEERDMSQKLAEAEAKIEAFCREHKIFFTLIRPTLIYDGQNDKNIAKLVKYAKRLRMVPVGGPALGLRQPIHADDVADAIMGAMDNEAARNRAFNIAGAEVMAYREMVRKVFVAHGIKPCVLSLPINLLQNTFRAARYLRLFRNKGYGYSVFQRMNQDQVFDIDEGLEVLQYKPRRFTPKLEEPTPEPSMDGE